MQGHYSRRISSEQRHLFFQTLPDLTHTHRPLATPIRVGRLFPISLSVLLAISGLSAMRRTATNTKGFRAPRLSSSHEQPADMNAVSANSAVPPPAPLSASTARKVVARDATAAALSPSPSSSPAQRRKCGSGGTRASTAAASTGDNIAGTGAGTTTVYSKSGGFPSLQAPRGLLSGHFSANYLRRAPRQRDQTTPHESASTTATGMRAPEVTTTVAPEAAQHASLCTSGDERAAPLNSGDLSLLRKRPRPLSPDGSRASGARSRDGLAGTRGCAPSVDRDSDTVKRDDTASVAQLFIPQLPTVPRLSTSHIPRTVFYPPSAEQPVALLRSPHNADDAGTIDSPEFALEPNVSSMPMPSNVCMASDNTVHARPWGSAAAVQAWTGADDGAPVAADAEDLRVPTSSSEMCVGSALHSSVAVSGHHTTFVAAVMTSRTVTSPSEQARARSLSALEQEQCDYVTALSTVPPLLPSPSPPFADNAPASALGGMPGQAGALVVAVAASGDEHHTLSSREPLGRLVAEPVDAQQQQASMHPLNVLTASEEAEKEESDEALEREMAEDLRMSTDIAFTPSGNGSGAPPLFSQSSMMQEEERQVEDEDGGEDVNCIVKGSAVTVDRTGDDCELRSGPEMNGQEGGLRPSFRCQDGADGVLISRSPPRPSIGVPTALPQHVFLSGSNHNGGAATTKMSGASPVSSGTMLPSALTDPPSAPSTWPIGEGTPPHLPSVLAPGTERSPPGVVTAAVAAAESGGLGFRRIDSGRHRTVFSFSSLRAGSATAASLSHSFPEQQPHPSEPSVVTRTGQACAGSARNMDSPVAEPVAFTAISPAPEACVRTHPVDLLLPPLPPHHVNSPHDALPMPVVSEGAKGETCATSSVLQNDAVAPTSTPPRGSDKIFSATGASTLLFPSTAPPLSDSYVTALPYLVATAVGSSSSATTLPARSGRTCFTLHSTARTTVTTSSAAATAIVESTATVATASTGAVPPQRTEEATTSVEGIAAGAAPRAASEIRSCRACSHEKGCTQSVIANAQPTLLRSVESSLATVSMHHPLSTSTTEQPVQKRGSLTLQQLTSLSPTTAAAQRQKLPPPHNNDYPPALLTVASVTPPVDCMITEITAVVAPQPVQEPAAHDETAQACPRESQTFSYAPLAPPQPRSPSLLRPVATDGTADLFYDLPREVGHFYATKRGVTSLYEWQHDVLTRPEVRQGSSFVYSLPTSGGKTLVAELSLLRCVLNRRKSCFLVLPFVSLAEEKTMALQPLATGFDFNVDGHYGSSGRFPLCGAPAVYVCTIEKANSLLNHMLEEGRTDEIGAVVVDELHMVGEPRRGATLELFLSKVLVIHFSRQRKRDGVVAPATQSRCGSSDARSGLPEELKDAEENLHESAIAVDTAKAVDDPGPLQIIGMSATVPNLRTLAAWLRAVCFEYNFRPVPLRAYSVVGGLVLRDGQCSERNLGGGSATQHLLELATEVPDASVLIFCASRQQCVDTAKGIVNYFSGYTSDGQKTPPAWMSASSDAAAAAQHASVLGVPFPSSTKRLAGPAAMTAASSEASAAIKGLLADLEALAHHEASQLSEMIAFGVAFHHGGLLAEERDLIEMAFRRKYIRILCCTSTLAAGVNLPARRVIIKTPYVGREFLTKSRYLQMCGRAGRAGLDPYGESFLLLSSRDQARGHALMHASVESCCSQLLEDDQMLTRSLLECVGVGLVADFQSACEWSGSLLSRWAVGPVDASWHPHITAASATAACANARVAPSGGAATDTLESATSFSHASGVGYDDDVRAAQDSESSRSAPGPPVSPPFYPSSPTSLPLTCVPPAAMKAMVRASLVTLARCGFINVVYTQASSSRSDVAIAVNSTDDTRTATATGTDAGDTFFKGSGTASSAALEMLWNRLFDDAHTAASGETHTACHVQVLATSFGSSSVRSCFSVEEALLLRAELDELRHTGLVLSDDLHLCYFLTPLREVGRCDWELLRLMMSRMSDSRQRIASLLGVDAYFVDQQAMGLGGPLEATEEGRRRLFTAKRFYVALMLADVLAEVPMTTVEQRYNVSRGQLQSLMRSASMFSSSITSFCHAMEWFSLEAVLSSFVKRLGFGVKPDLLPLMEIRGMQPPRARALWNAGFKNLASMAAADADDMVSKVKARNQKESKAAKYFTKRSALLAIREANLALQSQIKEKKGELQELSIRCGIGGAGARGAR
ncbi:DNA polymerase theta, putative [Leishmania tarentolae]|uniref:DNA polymerase theta, putative n=1 Tax=Leishmania tarentolae TaxID=5689 RepID=A0A640KHY2_LEITA|nr:DNA polymerase theta, putative [Leishmania tarentolae]